MNCTFRILPAPGAEANPRVELSVQAEEPIADSFDFVASANVKAMLQAIEESICPINDVREVGTRLWIALTPGKLGARLGSLMAEATPENPLQLRLDVPAGIDHLPWESLHHGEFGFLATDPRFSIVRTGGRPSKPFAPIAQVRVLVVSPTGTGLQTHYEWNNFKRLQGIVGGALKLEIIDGPTANALEKKLENNAFDVLHYMGHGRQAADGGVELMLNDPTGAAAWHAPEEFAKNLVGKGLRLCVINCCYSAAKSGPKSIGNIVRNISRMADVPAAIGMRYEVPDDVAIAFAASFYPQLLTGARPGLIASAVQAARLALINAFPRSNESRAFITPVLTAIPDQQLFALQAPVAPTLTVPVAATRLKLPAELLEGAKNNLYIPAIGIGLLRASQDTRKPGAAPRRCATEVIASVARACGFPVASDLHELNHGSDAFVSWVYARVCQYFQFSGRSPQRGRLVAALREAYRTAEPSPALLDISNWRVPAILYTSVDNLMSVALSAPPRPRQFRTINSLVDSPVEAAQYDTSTNHELMLVNVCGTLANLNGLTLTETDYEQLWDSLAREPPTRDVKILQHVVRQPERGLLFLGFSPRDTTARRLARLLDTDPRSGLQGRSFFVSSEHSPADDAYWSQYNVEFINAPATAVVERLNEVYR